MVKSPLDYDFRIGLDDIEERTAKRTRSQNFELSLGKSIFDEPKSKKERESGKKRQRENLRRYAWLSGKVCAVSLRLLGELLVWTGEKSKVGGHRLDEFATQVKPRKTSLRKGTRTLVGR